MWYPQTFGAALSVFVGLSKSLGPGKSRHLLRQSSFFVACYGPSVLLPEMIVAVEVMKNKQRRCHNILKIFPFRSNIEGLISYVKSVYFFETSKYQFCCDSFAHSHHVSADRGFSKKDCHREFSTYNDITWLHRKTVICKIDISFFQSLLMTDWRHSLLV